jgi:hypothetical protein
MLRSEPDKQDERFPFDITSLSQPLPERLDILHCSRWSGRNKVPDPRDLGRLLRVNRRAGCGDGDEKGGDDECSRAH